MAKSVKNNRWSKEELEARNAARKAAKQVFEKDFLPKFVERTGREFNKDMKAYILRVCYNIAQDLKMQMENLQDTEGTLYRVKENHFNAIKNLMDAVILCEASGEFHQRSEHSSELDEIL